VSRAIPRQARLGTASQVVQGLQVQPNALQSELVKYAQAIRELQQVEILDGRLITDVALTAGKNNLVKHKLGRTPLGWIVVRRNNSASIWERLDLNDHPDSDLLLQVASNVRASFWVF
jgi:hypothetical protein